MSRSIGRSLRAEGRQVEHTPVETEVFVGLQAIGQRAGGPDHRPATGDELANQVVVHQILIGVASQLAHLLPDLAVAQIAAPKKTLPTQKCQFIPVEISFEIGLAVRILRQVYARQQLEVELIEEEIRGPVVERADIHQQRDRGLSLGVAMGGDPLHRRDEIFPICGYFEIELGKERLVVE